MTLRAVDILGSADVVAAEDTRVTGGAAAALRHRDAAAVAARAQRGAARAAQSSTLLRAGRSVALVSDAGTPAVSDPGARLVRAVRDAGLPGGARFPAPNAAIAAVSAAGLDAERFVLLGFLPASAKARRELLAAVAALPLRARDLRGAASRRARRWPRWPRSLGGERELVVARETHQEVRDDHADCRWARRRRGSPPMPNRERGEFVLLVDAPRAAARRGRRSVDRRDAGCARSSPSCRRRAPRASSRRRSGEPRDGPLRAGAGAEGRTGLSRPLRRCTRPMTPDCRSPKIRAAASAARGWDARLALGFERAAIADGARARRHAARCSCRRRCIRKAPGVCQAIVVHPPGGIAGGDGSRSRSTPARARTRSSPRPARASGTARPGAARAGDADARRAPAALRRVAAAGDDRVRRRARGDRDCASSSPATRASSAGT